MKKNWWKALSGILIGYSIYAGFVNEVPRLAILNETIRNIYFHVPMWFAMMALYTASLVTSIMYLSKFDLKNDRLAFVTAQTGLIFGLLGLSTGMIWAKYTWGSFWVNDVKLNGSAAAVLVYAAYFVLRGSVPDEMKKARLAAVYNIFALL